MYRVCSVGVVNVLELISKSWRLCEILYLITLMQMGRIRNAKFRQWLSFIPAYFALDDDQLLRRVFSHQPLTSPTVSH